MKSCNHQNTKCLNHFELIRKYKCLDCGEIMMCECDKEIGEKYLSHQLSNGTELETQKRIPVTIGFQLHICRECKGLNPVAHPVAEIPGRTTKIRRYYWREIFFRKLEILGEWAEEKGIDDPLLETGEEAQKVKEKAYKQALKEIKKLHRENPKYSYSELTQPEVFKKYQVDVIDLHAMYVKGTEKRKAQVLYQDRCLTVENYVRAHFKKEGYESIFLESSPFHVLFGVFMWLVIQDPDDTKNRLAGFGDRNAYEAGEPNQQIWTMLPSDFGSQGYGERRKEAIDYHLETMKPERSELKWLFNYWLDYSEKLRQYLWAHKKEDIQRAENILDILPPKVVLKILKFLSSNYWKNYVGWPDLLIYKNDDYIFVEVKSSNDSLLEDQKRWIKNNYNILKQPFKLVKIHKQDVIKV